MMATYSAFFSSGFLATHIQIPPFQPQSRSQQPIQDSLLSPKEVSPSYFNFEFSPSPALPDSDIEIDDDDEMDIRRSVTPTAPPAPPAFTNPFPSITSSSTPLEARPKLRKRRSSLTIATSAIAAIRSPARTAQASASAALRARSGSVGTANPPMAVASEQTSLVGRMRSGSVGVSSFRVKRPNRRTATVPAPAPPPTAPLPAIPQFLSAPPAGYDISPRSAPLSGAFSAVNVPVPVGGARAVYEKKGRGRALSGAVGQWIEGIKEN